MFDRFNEHVFELDPDSKRYAYALATTILKSDRAMWRGLNVCHQDELDMATNGEFPLSGRCYRLGIDPDLFGSFLTWKFPMKTRNSIYLRQLFSFVLLAFLLFANTNNVADAKPTASVVHDIQFILALKGLYKGPLDGNCDEQTIAAIGRYAESAPEKQLFPTQCSGQLLATLIGDIGEALSATRAVPPLPDQQQNSTTEEIGDLKKKIEQIQENYHIELVSQFRQLATFSVSILAVIFTVLLAGLTIVGTNLAKTLLEQEHERQREKIEQKHAELVKISANTFDSMIAIARSQTAAHIYTSLANYCPALYMSLEKPQEGRQKLFYEAFIDLAVELTQDGFGHSKQLRQLIENGKSTPTTTQIMLLEGCMNNYAYFLAPRTLQENEGTDSAKVELKKMLIELEKLNATGPKWLEPWRLKETIAFVKLHLNRNFQEFERAVNVLITDENIPQSWKDDLRKKHAQHRLAHPGLYSPAAPPATPSHPSA